MHPTVNMATALERALLEADVTARDGAAVALARYYAGMLDRGQDVDRTGPQFLAVLTALGMTPASRAALVKGQPTHGPGERPETDDLERIRRGRQQRHSR